MIISDISTAIKQISLCTFCIDNVWGRDGWAKFGITSAKLEDCDAGNFRNEYDASLEQLLESAKDGCWWCGHITNTILKFNGQVRNPVRLALIFQVPRRREPRRLGLLFFNVGWDISSKRDTFTFLQFGMYSEPSKRCPTLYETDVS